jgi:aspartate aminotransferase
LIRITQQHKPSTRLQNIKESATLAMAQKVRDLQAQGYEITNLSLGLPDFNTPEFIKEAAKKAIDENFTKYSPVAGFLDLREAICKKLLRDNALTYTPNQIVVSNGVKHSLANLAISLLNPGDEVIILAPYWISYVEIVKIAGAKPVIVELPFENNYKPDIEKIEAAITENTKMLLFSSPNNPTGTVFSEDSLLQIANLIQKYPDILIVSDEIYEHINFIENPKSIAQFDHIYDQVITVNGISKGFAMTGWRIGYIAAPIWIAEACTKMQGQFTSGACSISQKAAKYALDVDPSTLKDMYESFRTRKNLMLSLLEEIEGIVPNQPEGALFIFPDVSSYFGKSYEGIPIKNSIDFCRLLLENGLVATTPGSAFGAPNNIRISYAVSEQEIEEAMQKMKLFLKKLT